jgi:hypothetical protein
VRVEYGPTLLGESSKIETTKDTRVADYNFTTSFECSFDEPYSLDGICQKPVVGNTNISIYLSMQTRF